MRLNIAVPETQVKKPMLDAALEAVTRLDTDLLRAGNVPDFRNVVHRLRWRPEPKGAECFDHAEKVVGRGWGDCDDLAPYYAASLRVSGEDPRARAEVIRTGPKRWHAIVRRSDGRIEDPSLAAGMPSPEGIRAAVLPTMAELTNSVSGVDVQLPHLAARPRFDADGYHIGWDARADIPWIHTASEFDTAMAALHSAPVASQAVVGALRHGADIGYVSGLVDEAVLRRAEVMADILSGVPPIELRGVYEDEEIVSGQEQAVGFLDDLANIASKVISFVPGVGPMVSLGIDAARGVAKGIDAANKAGAASQQNAAAQAGMRAAQNAAKRAAANMQAKRNAEARAAGGGVAPGPMPHAVERSVALSPAARGFRITPEGVFWG